jgi:hypothetical protein
MFEFIEVHDVAVSLFALFLIFVIKASFELKWLILMIVSLLFGIALNAQYNAKNNIAHYRKGKSLKCTINGFHYLVNKKDGWSVNKNSFLKDSLLIRADKCNEID